MFAKLFYKLHIILYALYKCIIIYKLTEFEKKVINLTDVMVVVPPMSLSTLVIESLMIMMDQD